MTFHYNRNKDKEKRRILRKNMTEAEKELWNKIRNKKMMAFRFLRQYSIDGFIIDFYCPKLRLAIEVDGGIHLKKENKAYDFERQKIIELFNINFIRIKNEEIFYNLEFVINNIKSIIEKIISSPLTKGEGKDGV